MRPYGVYPAIDVRVNGSGPYLFLIDTGANEKSRVDKSLASSLRLNPTGTAAAGTATSSATVQVKTLNLDRIDIQGIEFSNVRSHIGSYNTPGEYLPDIGGILALDLFADHLLTLDFCRREVVIDTGSLSRSDKGVVPYENREGIPYVVGTLAGEKLMFLLDTGTDRALDLPMEILRRQFLATFPRSLGSSHGLGGETYGIGEVILEDPVKVGAARFDHARATFSAAWHVPVIGSALLRRSAITFDQRHNLVKIVQGPACKADA